MLLVEGSCETGRFRHLSEHVLRSSQVRKYISFESHIFLKKCSKFDADLKIGGIKLSLLRRECLSMC